MISNTSKGLLAGLAGALSLTLAHEILRRIDPEAPRMDLLGMNATGKLLRKANANIPNNKNLYSLTLAGDIASNALFYGLSVLKGRSLLLQGSLAGLGMGAGAVLLPGSLGLKKEYSNHSTRTRLLTVALYTFGGLAAAATAKALASQKS